MGDAANQTLQFESGPANADKNDAYELYVGTKLIVWSWKEPDFAWAAGNVDVDHISNEGAGGRRANCRGQDGYCTLWQEYIEQRGVYIYNCVLRLQGQIFRVDGT